MAILGKFDRSGGFTVGDTETGATAYAYPTSPWATQAKRDAEWVAFEMAKRANTYGTHMTCANEAHYHRANWQTLICIPAGHG
jgi:hypothetical protein